MNLSGSEIDQIVANVLSQLKPAGKAAVSGMDKPRRTETAAPHPADADAQIILSDSVVTAETLASVPHRAQVLVVPKAIITPAAWDTVRERTLSVQRQAKSSPRASSEEVDAPAKTATVNPRALLLVVSNSEALERTWTDIGGAWRRELLGCPDDAATLAISELARCAVDVVMIFAEQTHRAACLANRHAQAKAAAIRDAGDMRLVRRQLKANVWCASPAGRSYFELRTLMQEAKRQRT